MTDPAVEAAQRAWEGTSNATYMNRVTLMRAAAREALKPVRELAEAFSEFYEGRNDTFAEGIKHVLRDIAPFIYPTEELERK